MGSSSAALRIEPPRQILRDATEIEVPAMLRGSGGHDREALGIGAEDRGEERLFQPIDHLRR